MGALPDRVSLLDQCAGFARALRRAGIPADPASTIEFCRALAVIDIANPADVRAAARATFVQRRDDLPLFEKTFVAHWYGRQPASAGRLPDGETEISGASPRTAREGAGDGPDNGPDSGEKDSLALYSSEERLMTRDLATLDERQVEQARQLLREFARTLPAVRTQRLRTARRGRVPDFRRLLRGLAHRGTDDVAFPHRNRPRRRSRLVVLCDVSGSMRGYTEFILELIYGLRRELPTTEIGVFSTRLTIVSDLLSDRNLASSLREMLARAVDWGGGTDIGGCLRDFNRLHGRTLVSSRSVLVIVSDGLDRGDPRVMQAEMDWLRRHVSRIIWLTPLLRFADYQPLTRGMLTAMPHLDLFLPCHSIEALTRFARLLRLQWA